MHGLIPLLSRFVYFNRSDDLLSCHPSSSGVPPEHQRGRGDDAGHLPLRELERGDDRPQAPPPNRLRAPRPHARRPPDQRRGQRRVRERPRALRAGGHGVDLGVLLHAHHLLPPAGRERRAAAGSERLRGRRC